MARTPDKVKAKSNWMEQFAEQRTDLFYPEVWTDEQRALADDITSGHNIKKMMYNTIPMICKNDRCQVKSTCPLYAKGIAPEGKPCPIEMRLIQEIAVNIMNALKVDPDDFIEVSQVRDMVRLEIQELRATQIMAYEDLVQESIIGISERTGEPIIKKDLHAVVALQEKILRQKKDARSEMLASRQAKAKVGLGTVDNAKAIANVFQMVREADIAQQKAINKHMAQLDAIDAEIIEDEIEDE